MSNEPIISVRDLVFDYPNKRALHGVSLDVPQGAVLALVGPNGAGKSTLMRVIAGLDDPVDGTVFVAGTDVLEDPRAAHRQLGYLADFFGLYEDLTVERCLTHAAAIRGVLPEAVPERVMRTAARLGLQQRLNETAGQLSRGLKQRLAIGQALIHEPRVLLLDEPAAGLDPDARASLAKLFRELRAGGMTLLVSSHILAELEEYSTHMLAIGDGKILSYQALGAQQSVGSASAKREIKVRLAGVLPEPALLQSLLEAQSTELVSRSADGYELHLRLDAEPRASVVLLRELVNARLEVMEFYEYRESLQDSYLRSVREAKSAAQGARA